jgi:hypothetical protein
LFLICFQFLKYSNRNIRTILLIVRRYVFFSG